jgi:hypothetical protein
VILRLFNFWYGDFFGSVTFQFMEPPLMKVIKKAAACLLGAATLLSPGYGEIYINDLMSLSGFIDMSYVNNDPKGGTDTSTATLDQIEFDFMFDFGEGFSAQIDIEGQSDNTNVNGNEYEVDVEQAFFNYQLTDEFSMKAGRFLAYSGWETEEPTGLFQYSGTGYGGLFYGGYQTGVSAMYSGAMVDFGLSVVDDIAQPTTGSGNAKDLAIEAMVAFHPTEAITVKAFYLTDETAGVDTDVINVWASYAVGGFTFAAEYGTNETGTAESDGFLLMGNYAWDKYGITLRYHGWETDTAGAKTYDGTGFTIAPSMAVNEYLLLVAEYRTESIDVGGTDYDQIAFEALVSF